MKKILLCMLLWPALSVAQLQTVTVGASANNGQGDPLRTAFTKLNANDTTLFTQYNQTPFEVVTPVNFGYPPGDVRRYGAKCDGSTDDSVAFQNAANANTTVVVPQTASSCVLNSTITGTNIHWIVYGKLTGTGGLAGLGGYTATQFYTNTGLPTTIQPFFRVITESKGDNTTAIGTASGYFEARDRTDVTAANKGVLYALSLSVVPSQARNHVPVDDVDGLTIGNTTGTAGAKATDGIYISHNFNVFGSTSSEWYSLITADANADVGIALNGRLASYGIDLNLANIVSSAAIRFGNGQGLYSRNAGSTGDLSLVKLDANNYLQMGDTNTGEVKINSGLALTNPVVISSSPYTVAPADNYLIENGPALTMTLPVAGSYPGRVIKIKTTGNAVTSASSNVVPLAGGAAGSAVLAGSAGKWAELVSDGANWQTMSGN